MLRIFHKKGVVPFHGETNWFVNISEIGLFHEHNTLFCTKRIHFGLKTTLKTFFGVKFSEWLFASFSFRQAYHIFVIKKRDA